MPKVMPKDIREIVRLKEMNISEREIARRTNTSKGTVGRVWAKARENGWTAKLLRETDAEEIKQMFFPKDGKHEATKPMPDFQTIHSNLSKYRDRSLFHEWYKYRKNYPDGYSYGWTTVLYNRWCNEHHIKPVLLMNEPAGQCMYVDWAGRTMKFHFDNDEAETEVHFFVSTLGASQYPYVEPTLNEKQDTMIRCHINALRYYGGVPKYMVPDNMRSAVRSHKNYEVELQSLYEDLQDFYGYVVLPAHKSSPTEKNDVENEVNISYDWVLSELDEHSGEYHNMDDVRRATARYLDEMCRLEFRKTGLDRREWFNKVDAPELRPLPKEDFAIYAYEFITVPPDYHVNIEKDKHKYSVPHQYIGKNVMMKYTYTKLRVFNSDHELIVEWPRSHSTDDLNTVHTSNEHRPISHQIAAVNKTRDPSWILEKAREIGPNTEKYIQLYMGSYKNYERALDGCMGIITMTWGRKQKSPAVSRSMMEEICREGMELKVYNYGFVKNRAAEVRNRTAESTMKQLIEKPANARGKENYK